MSTWLFPACLDDFFRLLGRSGVMPYRGLIKFSRWHAKTADVLRVHCRGFSPVLSTTERAEADDCGCKPYFLPCFVTRRVQIGACRSRWLLLQTQFPPLAFDKTRTNRGRAATALAVCCSVHHRSEPNPPLSSAFGPELRGEDARRTRWCNIYAITFSAMFQRRVFSSCSFACVFAS